VLKHHSIRKKRCIPTSPESIGPCKLCQSLSAPCSLVPNFQHNPPIEGLLSLPDTTQSIESASPSTQRYRDNHDPSHTSILPPKALLRDLINLYFRLIHNGPHTLFHEPTFHAEFESDNLPPYLLLAIASVSARYTIPFLVWKISFTHIDFQQMRTFQGSTHDCGAKNMAKLQCDFFSKI
jgi:hypothetical protein